MIDNLVKNMIDNLVKNMIDNLVENTIDNLVENKLELSAENKLELSSKNKLNESAENKLELSAENKNDNSSISYNHINKEICIKNNIFDVDTFLNNIHLKNFGKVKKIIFLNCSLSNKELIISKLTCALGSIIIEGINVFSYITSDADIIDFDINQSTISSSMSLEDNIMKLTIYKMQEYDIKLFILKLKQGILFQKNSSNNIFAPSYILIEDVKFINYNLTESNIIYLKEMIAYWSSKYKTIVDDMNILAYKGYI